MTSFASLVQDYIRAHGWGRGWPEGRMVALVGDAELDEGNIYEALIEGWKHELRNTWWVIDYNRQSLDAVISAPLTGKLTTKAEDVADIKNRKEVFDSAVASDMQVRVEGNTGIVTGIYHLKGRDDKGQALDRRIRFTDIYVKKDGRWQVIGSQGTLIK